MNNMHPALIVILGGLLTAILPKRIRQLIMIGVPLLTIFVVLSIKPGTVWEQSFITSFNLVTLKADKLSLIFALAFSAMALLGNIYALHIDNRGECVAGMLYAGSSLGVVFAGDWMTLIFFWELMAVSSTFLIWYRGDKKAISAGFRYFLIHTLGGNLLLAGIFLKVTAGQPYVSILTGTGGWSFWLILVGMSINAAIPPLHAWLTDAYPEATITGTVFMSSFTTKVTIYTLIRVFPGTELLIWAGVIMAIYGVIYAVMENDFRRLLSYHIISQLGFMVACIGIGTDLALNGAAALAISNIIYKGLLFMGAGAVIYATGLRKLTDAGGLYRKMPLTAIFFGIGAYSISGLPLSIGFVTKSITISAAAVNHMPKVELLLYLAGIGTLLSIAFKLFYFLFFGPDRGIEVKEIPKNMYVAMAGGALLCIVYGVLPEPFYARLPYPMEYHPYTWDHVVSTFQLAIGALITFYVLIPKLHTHDTISLDFEWVYRKPFKVLVYGIVNIVCKVRDELGIIGMNMLKSVIPFFANPLKWVPKNIGVPHGEGSYDVYDEDNYRFPAGMTVLMSVIMFIITVSYIWL